MDSRSKKQERKARRNVIIAGLIMIFLMVFSMLAVYVSNQENNALKYGNTTFNIEQVQGSQMYSTKLNGQKYYFYTLPDAATAAIGDLTGIDRISTATTLIFTENPLGIDAQASSEQITFYGVAKDLSMTAGKTILAGITKEDSLSTQKVFTCDNATTNMPVLMLNESVYSVNINVTEIKPNCFEINAGGMDLLIMRDYILYRSLGIITN
jgi:hypothetical protein